MFILRKGNKFDKFIRRSHLNWIDLGGMASDCGNVKNVLKKEFHSYHDRPWQSCTNRCVTSPNYHLSLPPSIGRASHSDWVNYPMYHFQRFEVIFCYYLFSLNAALSQFSLPFCCNLQLFNLPYKSTKRILCYRNRSILRLCAVLIFISFYFALQIELQISMVNA